MPVSRRASISVWLGGILLVAAGLRLAYLVVLWRSPLFLLNGLTGLDMATYYGMAERFAHLQLPERAGPFFQAPLYPLFLAGVLRLAPSLAAGVVANVGLGVLACGLVYELGRTTVSARVGLVAAALWAVYPLSWYYGGLLLSENLLVVLLVGLALVVTRVLEPGAGRRTWVALGVECGLATVCRANLALVLPIVCALVLLRGRPPRAAIGVGLGCFAAVVLPAAVYNSIASGTLQFTSTQGSHLWLAGNTEFATGLYQLPCGPAMSVLSGEFWALQGRKLLLFFSNEEFGNNTYVGVFRTYLGQLALPPVGFGALAAPGLLGLLVAGRSRLRQWRGLLVVLGVYAGTIALFAIVGRYRLPAAALLCVPAAAVVVGIGRVARERRTALAIGLVAAVMVAANVGLPYDVSVPFAHANAASVFAESGDTATAEVEAQAAHAARLEVEERDAHGCSQLQAF